MKYSELEPDAGAALLDLDLVTNLAQLVTRLGLSEIAIEKGDFKVRIARQLAAPAAPAAALPAVPQQPAAPAAVPFKEPAKAEGQGLVKSPMVGTVYLRPSPDAPSFVDIGSKVITGDKLLLVEAMKTFNEILAPCDGTVSVILVEDGQPVEYGQPLIAIE